MKENYITLMSNSQFNDVTSCLVLTKSYKKLTNCFNKFLLLSFISLLNRVIASPSSGGSGKHGLISQGPKSPCINS